MREQIAVDVRLIANSVARKTQLHIFHLHRLQRAAGMLLLFFEGRSLPRQTDSNLDAPPAAD